MGYWYATLYVVIEGYQELKMADSVIDLLLQSPNVKSLRRFRNGICHYQKEYFDELFMGICLARFYCVNL